MIDKVDIMSVYPISPYEYMRPLSPFQPYAFIQRNELNVIDELVFAQGGNCLLVGGPKVGKTSLIRRLARKSLTVPVSYRIGEEEQTGEFSLWGIRQRSSRDALTSLWRHVLFSLVDKVRGLEEIDQKKADRLDSMSRIMLKRKGPIDNESIGIVGQRIAEFGVRVALVLDDFDDLLQDRFFDADFFEALFEQLFVLAVESKRKFRTILCSSVAVGKPDMMQVHTLRGLLAAKVETAREVRKRRFQRLCDDFLADFDLLELSLFSTNEIRELVNMSGKLPADAWQEVYKESGGHPFLAQMFCYYAAKSCEDRTCPIEWPKIRDFVERDEAFNLFMEEVWNACTAEEMTLVRIASGNGSPQQVRLIEAWKLPYGGLPWSIPVDSPRMTQTQTQSILESLVSKPATKGLIFREAKSDETRVGRPELVWVMREAVAEEQSEYYMVGARAVWRALQRQMPRARRPGPTRYERFFRPIEGYYVPYLTLTMYIVTWVILDVLKRDTDYAVWALPWILLYWIIGKVLDSLRRA
jgi:hypothetical protein